jgi:hypothetical protein
MTKVKLIENTQFPTVSADMRAIIEDTEEDLD